MANDKAMVEIDQWLLSPPGRYVLAWQQQQLDQAVADLFGFHALQVGWPALQGLRANRMPHRWMLSDARQAHIGPLLDPGGAPVQSVDAGASPYLPLSILADFEALPFPSQSLDLVVLPHTLEVADDPHETLREVERVLMPEGKVLILGFNPGSLLGASCAISALGMRFGLAPSMVPLDAEMIGWRRLRDWLRLLGFDIEVSRFGCYRPPLSTERWLDRTEWLESAGARWWPVFGSVYFVMAVKRVRGMRLIGPAWKKRRRSAASPAVVAQTREHDA